MKEPNDEDEDQYLTAKEIARKKREKEEAQADDRDPDFWKGLGDE